MVLQAITPLYEINLKENRKALIIEVIIEGRV